MNRFKSKTPAFLKAFERVNEKDTSNLLFNNGDDDNDCFEFLDKVGADKEKEEEEEEEENDNNREPVNSAATTAEREGESPPHLIRASTEGTNRSFGKTSYINPSSSNYIPAAEMSPSKEKQPTGFVASDFDPESDNVSPTRKILRAVMRKCSSERFILRPANYDETEDDDGDIVENDKDKDKSNDNNFSSMKWGSEKSSSLLKKGLSLTSHGERKTNVIRNNLGGGIVEEDSTASIAEDFEEDAHEVSTKADDRLNRSFTLEASQHFVDGFTQNDKMENSLNFGGSQRFVTAAKRNNRMESSLNLGGSKRFVNEVKKSTRDGSDDEYSERSVSSTSTYEDDDDTLRAPEMHEQIEALTTTAGNIPDLIHPKGLLGLSDGKGETHGTLLKQGVNGISRLIRSRMKKDDKKNSTAESAIVNADLEATMIRVNCGDGTDTFAQFRLGVRGDSMMENIETLADQVVDVPGELQEEENPNGNDKNCFLGNDSEATAESSATFKSEKMSLNESIHQIKLTDRDRVEEHPSESKAKKSHTKRTDRNHRAETTKGEEADEAPRKRSSSFSKTKILENKDSDFLASKASSNTRSSRGKNLISTGGKESQTPHKRRSIVSANVKLSSEELVLSSSCHGTVSDTTTATTSQRTKKFMRKNLQSKSNKAISEVLPTSNSTRSKSLRIVDAPTTDATTQSKDGNKSISESLTPQHSPKENARPKVVSPKSTKCEVVTWHRSPSMSPKKEKKKLPSPTPNCEVVTWYRSPSTSPMKDKKKLAVVVPLAQDTDSSNKVDRKVTNENSKEARNRKGPISTKISTTDDQLDKSKHSSRKSKTSYQTQKSKRVLSKQESSDDGQRNDILQSSSKPVDNSEMPPGSGIKSQLTPSKSRRSLISFMDAGNDPTHSKNDTNEIIKDKRKSKSKHNSYEAQKNASSREDNVAMPKLDDMLGRETSQAAHLNEMSGPRRLLRKSASEKELQFSTTCFNASQDFDLRDSLRTKVDLFEKGSSTFSSGNLQDFEDVQNHKIEVDNMHDWSLPKTALLNGPSSNVAPLPTLSRRASLTHKHHSDRNLLSPLSKMRPSNNERESPRMSNCKFWNGIDAKSNKAQNEGKTPDEKTNEQDSGPNVNSCFPLGEEKRAKNKKPKQGNLSPKSPLTEHRSKSVRSMKPSTSPRSKSLVLPEIPPTTISTRRGDRAVTNNTSEVIIEEDLDISHCKQDNERDNKIQAANPSAAGSKNDITHRISLTTFLKPHSFVTDDSQILNRSDMIEISSSEDDDGSPDNSDSEDQDNPPTQETLKRIEAKMFPGRQKTPTENEHKSVETLTIPDKKNPWLVNAVIPRRNRSINYAEDNNETIPEGTEDLVTAPNEIVNKHRSTSSKQMYRSKSPSIRSRTTLSQLDEEKILNSDEIMVGLHRTDSLASEIYGSDSTLENKIGDLSGEVQASSSEQHQKRSGGNSTADKNISKNSARTEMYRQISDEIRQSKDRITYMDWEIRRLESEIGSLRARLAKLTAQDQ